MSFFDFIFFSSFLRPSDILSSEKRPYLTNVYVYAFIYVCIYIRIYMHKYVHIYVYTYVYMYMYMYIMDMYMYIRICTYILCPN